MKASDLIKILQSFISEAGDKDIYIGIFCDSCDDLSNDFQDNYIKNLDVRFLDHDYIASPDPVTCNNIIGFAISKEYWS